MRVSSFFQSVIPKAFIGVDIGTYSVKVAQIKKKRFSDKKFLSLGIKDIKQPLTHESIVTAIKAACKEIKMDSNKVNISVYGTEIIMRYITLPVLETSDLSRCLEFELERYIPGKQKSHMVIDFKILYRLPNNQMAVLLIALEKQVMQERLALINDAGLVPVSVGVDSLVLMEACKPLVVPGKKQDVTAVLDVGYSVSKLVVFQGDTPYFSRDINTSGVYNFLQMVSENMGLNPEQAQDALFNPADKMQQLYESIKLNLDSLTDELRLSFEYCGRNLQKKVNQLYLTGGGSKIKVLNENLAAGLNLSTVLLDVTQGFSISCGLAQQNISPLITVAVGLAMG
ncbi:MAG: type IV pilus assembly protein PilM [Candidatus Omnitrophota bacterium]